MISIASLTKLVTSIAVLQLVEKGLISLDEDVAELIPSLASQVVLDGFDTNGQPLTHARRNMITVRRLLTHSAGASYHFTDPRIQQVQALRSVQDESTAGTVERNFSYPLSYEPGEGFMYSSSLDWAGQIVEKVSRLGLEDYFQKYIFKPLRITTGTFWSTDHAPMSVRPAPDEPVETKHGSWNFATGWTECSGGQGLFMSMEDYVKILHSLLLDDEILLKSETAAELFRPCLSVASNAELSKRMETPNWLVGDFSGPTKYDWSLGGLLVDGDDHEYRRRNAVMWSAASSCFWVCMIGSWQVWDYRVATNKRVSC